jgi:hypothetical protein
MNRCDYDYDKYKIMSYWNPQELRYQTNKHAPLF